MENVDSVAVMVLVAYGVLKLVKQHVTVDHPL